MPGCARRSSCRSSAARAARRLISSRCNARLARLPAITRMRGIKPSSGAAASVPGISKTRMRAIAVGDSDRNCVAQEFAMPLELEDALASQQGLDKTKKLSANEIPIIDVGGLVRGRPGAAAEVARQFVDAFTETGFC